MNLPNRETHPNVIGRLSDLLFSEYRRDNPEDLISDDNLREEMITQAEEEMQGMFRRAYAIQELLARYPEDVKEELRARFDKRSEEEVYDGKIKPSDLFHRIIAEYENEVN